MIENRYPNASSMLQTAEDFDKLDYEMLMSRKAKMWHEDTKFKAVIVHADNPSQTHQELPTRDTVAEVKLDILCFQHQCRCHKVARPAGCLRYTRVEPLGIHLAAYVENDRGSRSWMTSSTVLPLLPKDE